MLPPIHLAWPALCEGPDALIWRADVMSRVTAVTRAQGSTVRLEASAPRKRGALEERATFVDPRKQKLHRARGGAARWSASTCRNDYGAQKFDYFDAARAGWSDADHT